MIDADKYNSKIQLNCPTCGGSQFEYEDSGDDSRPISCPSCGLIITKSELISMNGEKIDSEIDEIKAQMVRDIKKSLKDALKGSNFIKLK